MNVNIEKITNGYILTVDGAKTFCDVPEAICGTMAELILKHCKELETKPSATEFATAMQRMINTQMKQPSSLSWLAD